MKRSEEAFNKFWDSIIFPQMTKLAEEAGVSIDEGPDKVRESTRKLYAMLNEHCSEWYMSKPEKLLDRHKLAACYMYAIIAARPLAIDSPRTTKTESLYANERLAITTGCSILVSYKLEAIDDPQTELTPEERAHAKERATRGVRFPDEVAHGEYVLNTAKALSFTQIEGTYNILLLATLLFHWDETLADEKAGSAIRESYKKMVSEEN